jgi:drug/metabolite transporter (DMT)-like permease
VHHSGREIWGSTYFAIKIALVSFPPFFQIGTRLSIALIALAATSIHP